MRFGRVETAFDERVRLVFDDAGLVVAGDNPGSRESREVAVE